MSSKPKSSQAHKHMHNIPSIAVSRPLTAIVSITTSSLSIQTRWGVNKYQSLRSETLELAVGIANSLGELGVILDAGCEQFFEHLWHERERCQTTVEDVLSYVFALPAPSTGASSSTQAPSASLAPVTVGSCQPSPIHSAPPLSLLEIDQQTNDSGEPEEDQLAPVMDNEKQCCT
ncbi:hypothetical protein B0H17DRAFT_1203708 [Mycena rosella]|uniref:Uncharacterized protein n=1 Tax=Mycena rosella TaxID=1033263 RepID=A0AAD7DAW0_MYCRO|nr:hypothetical protein B0H17DRAFT_1203708 [Mycena rosella]